jgi:hypothetical protein
MKEKGKVKNKMFTNLIVGAGVALLGTVCSFSQDKPKPETYGATAIGEGPAAGRTFNVTITIQGYSTPEDQRSLIDSFTSSGQKGLVETLSKMKSKGRVAITGTLGYDIAYVRKSSTDNGSMIRLITNRPIRFREAWDNGRSTSYNLSALELTLTDAKTNNTGSLMVAAKFTVGEDKQPVLESYRAGPWRLVNIIDWE